MSKNKEHDLEVLTADVVAGLLTGLAVAMLSGCSTSTGWSLNVGITPISRVNEHRTLGQIEQEEQTEVKKAIW